MSVRVQKQMMSHVVPDEDFGQHHLDDGIWCCCSPKAMLDEDDDALPVEIRHVKFRLRMFRRTFT